MVEVAIGFGVLFILLFLEVPIAFGMALVGYFGLVHFLNTNAALSVIGNEAFGQILNYDFAVLPLFILMGNFIARSGISNDLYDASNAWVGHTRGGLATATIVACGRVRVVAGDLGDHDQGRDAVDAPLRLRRFAGGGLDRGGRHARHPDPAVGRAGLLRDHDRHRHRQAVRRRPAAGHPRHPALHLGDRHRHPDQPGTRPPR